jgi:hypothetical protein
MKPVSRKPTYSRAQLQTLTEYWETQSAKGNRDAAKMLAAIKIEWAKLK